MDQFLLCFALLVLSGWTTERVAATAEEERYERYVKLLSGPLSRPRHAFVNEENWRAARRFIVDEFQTLLDSAERSNEFQVPVSLELHDFESEVAAGDQTIPAPVRGQNVVARFDGRRRGTDADRVLVVAAHYDSDWNTCGVADNGSGVAALLVTASRLVADLMRRRAHLLNTVLFVAFDIQNVEHETRLEDWDDGAGSAFFVREALHAVLSSTPAPTFAGAIIFDSILNYNTTVNSQVLPDGFQQSFPEAYRVVAGSNFTGNFLAMVTKEPSNQDPTSQQLEDLFAEKWRDVNATQAASCPLVVLQIRRALASTATSEFLKQDHRPFWNYIQAGQLRPLPAILLTDTAKWRATRRPSGPGACDSAVAVDADQLKLIDHVVATTHRFIVDTQETEAPARPSAATGGSFDVTALLAMLVVLASVVV